MKKILIVDDSPTVRLACSQILNDLNIQVLQATQGEEALVITNAHPDIDAILLDWNMPIMNGLEFLKALRQKDLDQQPTVLMCTTENDLKHIQEAIQAGANEYIMKPFTEDIIVEKLTAAGVL